MIYDVTREPFDASANEPSNNTAAIQKALDYADMNDTVLIPPGTDFQIDPAISLRPRSGTSLRVDGILRALPMPTVPVQQGHVVLVSAVSDVKVCGDGQIIGERDKHAPGGGKYCHCLSVVTATHVDIGDHLTLRDAWADGIYLQDVERVSVEGVISTNNSRNAMSIISGSGIEVRKNTFGQTHSESPMPQAGIDIEPDLPAQQLLDIWISENRFTRNKGAGVYIAFEPASHRRQVFVVRNVMDQHYKDGSGPPIGGRNTVLAKFLYATCRWVPGYDYWGFKSEFTLS